MPGEIRRGQIAVAVAAIEAHEWQAAREALAPYLDDRPPARICALMARIEAGQGDMGREREWLARAVRAPRDRAWIADGYVSDRWLPVSPVTGAVDAFEWKAPVDAIGRGDDTLLIEERPEPVTVSAQVLAPFAPPRAETARIEKKDAGEIVDVGPKLGRERPAATEAPPPPKTAVQDAPRSPAEHRLNPRSSCPSVPPTIRAWRRRRPTRARPRSSACARRKSAKAPIPRAGEANLASPRQWP